MAAFLLSWNPERFAWEDLRKNIAAIQRKGSIKSTWSSGNRTDMPKGSDFYLIRLGPVLKGLVGRGVTLSEPYEGKHWDPEKRRAKVLARYVDVRFTDLREEPVIPWDELQRVPLSRFQWSIYASGVAMPEVIVDEVNERWGAFKASTKGGSPAGDWSDYPFADELALDQVIWRDPALSVTEKEALIQARRGQGIFRANVL